MIKPGEIRVFFCLKINFKKMLTCVYQCDIFKSWNGNEIKNLRRYENEQKNDERNR
jgi:hypothetical protein